MGPANEQDGFARCAPGKLSRKSEHEILYLGAEWARIRGVRVEKENFLSQPLANDKVDCEMRFYALLPFRCLVLFLTIRCGK